MFAGIAHVLVTGCPESRLDSTRAKNFLIENGWTITDEVEEADLVLFRACGLTNDHIDYSIELIESLKSEKKANAKLIVWGCLPKINMEALRTVYTGVTFGEDEINIFDKILEAKKPIAEITGNSCMPVLKPKPHGLTSRIDKFFSKNNAKFSIAGDSIFQIKASTGCLGSCSFCSVPKSRGSVKSKTVNEIVTEFHEGLDNGFRYFGLLGTDLGSYGRDLGINLVDLLGELTKEKGDYKIGLRNVNPYFLSEMFEELKPFFSSGKIWFISSSVQSGSDRILKLMGRRYKIQDFIKCIKTLNDEYPNILLRTQLLIGFPGETNEDFQMTKKFIDELKFDWVEIYKYSPNSGTPAATMLDQVPEDTKTIRYRQLFFRTRLKRSHKKIIQNFV